MRSIIVFFVVNMLAFSSMSYARDDINDYSIQDALSSVHAKDKLGNDVTFHFGKQKHGKVFKKKGLFKTNKKTNAFNKTDSEACEWVFLSAMIALKEQAEKKGANAVINIKSNYKNNLTSSNKTFQCGSGTFIAGVALVGDIVTIK